jgi:hypothetical protein
VKLALIALVILVAVSAVTAEHEQPVEDVGSIMVAFSAHLDDHPLAGAEDLYKFFHQAVYGPGHAIPNREAAAAWLEREIDGLGPLLDDEPTCESLGGEPPLVRVNLRPFVARGGDPDLLLDAFVASANRDRGSSPRMANVLSLAASYVQCAGRGELAPELKTLSAELAEKGYRAIHHSEAYAKAYQPAYRVVDEALAAKHGWCEEPLER